MYRSIIFAFIFLLSACKRSFGIIYRLNETEYEKLPRLFELENYDACLENPGAVYCVASLSLQGEPDNRLYNIIQEYSEESVKHFNYSHISRGVCVTKTCHSYIKRKDLNINDDLELIFEGCLNEIMEQKYNLSLTVLNLNCDKQTDQETKLDYLDYIVGAIIVSLCILVTAGSYYDIKSSKATKKEKKSRENKTLLCFSMFRNMDRLKNEAQIDERLLELKGIHGIRTIAEIFIIFGHSLFTFSAFVSDPHTLEKTYDNTFRLFFSGTSFVQLFFFITGFLMTYYLQINSEKRLISWKNIPNIVFLRWWKLTFPLSIVGAFILSWLRHLGSGPLWKSYITNGVTRQCRDYLWTHILYINNYFEKDKFCLLQTWHLAVDMHLFLIGLIVYFSIRNRSWRFKTGTIILLLIISVVIPILQLLSLGLDGYSIYTPEVMRTLNDDKFRKYHVLVQNNMSCFILGMGNGYLGYYLKWKKIQFPYPKLGNGLCWLCVFLIIGVFYMRSFIFEDVRPTLIWRILFESLHRVVIGIILSVWVLGAIFKFNGFFSAIFEWRGFLISSKLSYGVFLVHIEILNILIAIRTQVVPISFFNLFLTYLGVVFISYLLALVLYMLVEAPASQFLKLFLEDIRKKKEA